MWTITHLPPRKKTLECKWVYKVRHNTDGTWERYKARLVTLRNHQIKWVDYDGTFAHVVKNSDYTNCIDSSCGEELRVT